MYQSLARLAYLTDVRKKAQELREKTMQMDQNSAIVMIQAVEYISI